MTKELCGITKEDAIILMRKCNDINQWSDIAYKIKSRCYNEETAILGIKDARNIVDSRLDEICTELVKKDTTDKLIRLRRGEDYPDKVVKVTTEEYLIMFKLVAKYGTLYDAPMSDEEGKLVYGDIEKREDKTPNTYDTFYMRER